MEQTPTQAPEVVVAVKTSANYIAYEKMLDTVSLLETRMQEDKKALDYTKQELKNLRKQIEKLHRKQVKQDNKPKKTRKPHGFAKPTNISDELCVFLGKNAGELVSRTEVTKSIIKYISDNKLQNPENRRQIILDDTLKKLFGLENQDVNVDYFSMQKYVNKHFPKKSENVPIPDA